MEWMDRALAAMAEQTKTASQAYRLAGDCAASALEFSAEFLRGCAERNKALGQTLMNARTFDAAAKAHGDFVSETMRANGQFAARLGEAMSAAGENARRASQNAAS